MKKCQLIGPISGTGDYIERFEVAEQEVTQMGMTPINPVTMPHDHDKSWEAYMRETIKSMMEVDTVYVMKGWHKSEGARMEVNLAIILSYKMIDQ